MVLMVLGGVGVDGFGDSGVGIGGVGGSREEKK